MWYQCLRRVIYSLVAVLVIAGPLAFLGCSGDDDDDNTTSSQTGAILDPAQTRTNVTSDNGVVLLDQDISIDGAAFAFDTLTAPAGATLRITNPRPVTTNTANPPVVTGPPPTFGEFAPPLAITPVPGVVPVTTFANVACPSNLPAAGSATNPGSIAGAANPTAVADYTINRDDGTNFAGTLCIGAGTTSKPGGPPGQGGNICVFTNFLGSPGSPGAQTVYSTCRIAVGVSPQQFVPVNTPLPGTLQLVVSQPITGVGFTSGALSVTVTVGDNGDGTGGVSVNGIPMGITVDLTTTAEAAQ
jgi:hypothetical protein